MTADERCELQRAWLLDLEDEQKALKKRMNELERAFGEIQAGNKAKEERHEPIMGHVGAS